LGEFQGEDVGSPVHVRLRMDCTPLTRYQPRGISAGALSQGQRFTGGPLEALVEQEPIHREGVAQPRMAAEAGLHFLRLLGNSPHRAEVLSRYPLQAPAEDPQRPLDGETRRFLQVMAGRVPDGALLYSVLRAVSDASTLNRLLEPYKGQVAAGAQAWQTWRQKLSPADQAQLGATVASWLEWYKSLFSEADAVIPGSASWVPDRMEYEVAVAAPTPRGEVVLAAPEYTGEHLDWYSFDVMAGGSLGAARTDLSPEEVNNEAITRSALPVPVSFRGMPSDRWWEFEDARVDFGAVQAGAQDLVRLLLLEFAVQYSNDWFVLPVEMPVGSVSRVEWLVVTDTFGERTLVRSSREIDKERHGPAPQKLPFDLFGLSADRRPAAAGNKALPDAFFLPPALATSLHSAPLEEVHFVRDELANMAWAVERVVESPLGRPVNRAELSHTAPARQPDPGDLAATGNVLSYLLAPEVPAHWVPLFPVRLRAGEPAIGLQRGGAPQGRILEAERKAGDPLIFNEEEVPRAGARVTRSFQYARWVDGKTYLWVGRQKGTGRSEGVGGLRFDVLEPREASR
jgi:hypothetical protein